MRPDADDILAPPFPPRAPWINVASLRMDRQRGRPVLVEFWDFCRVNSLRTLPYLKEWHARYAPAGLRVVGAHVAGFPCSQDPEAVRAAVVRLGIAYPVVVDTGHELWSDYGVVGWPSRYLWDGEGRLVDFHFGEGGYPETERAIQELLGIERPPVEPVRPEDVPGATMPAPSPDREGAWSGDYRAGGVWAVLDGRGEVAANGRRIEVSHPGCYALVEHGRHTAGRLALEVGAGVVCHSVCFTPALAGEHAGAPAPAQPGAAPGRRSASER